MVYFDYEARSQLNESARERALQLADRLDDLGFPRQAKGIRCCGLALRSLAGRLLTVLPCNLRFCPVCRKAWRSKMIRKWCPKIAAIAGVDGEVVALTLTLPPSEAPLSHRKAALRAAFAKVLQKHAWKGEHGHVRRVGVLAVLEIGRGGMEDGQPHLHLLFVSSALSEATAAAAWVLGAWLEQNARTSPMAQKLQACAGPQDFKAWLEYILKGTMVDPLWEDSRLEATVITLIDRSHRLSAYGLLGNRRGKVPLKAS